MAAPTFSYLRQFVNLNIAEGENAAKRVDADYVNEFGIDIARATSDRMASGDKADNGAGGAARCIMTLRSDSSRLGLIKNGDWYKVTELATGAVWTGTAQADDVIAFSTAGGGGDGALMEGAAPGNYSLDAFIDDLRVEIHHQLHSKTQVQQLNLDDAAIGGLDTAHLLRPGGAVVENEMVADQARFLIDHGAAGDHNAGVIDEPQFADTAFENFNYANILANGGAEVGYAGAGDPTVSIGDNAPFYWSGVAGRLPGNGPYITIAQIYEGRHSCYVGFTAANQAIDLEFDPLEFDITQHVGKWVALTIAVWATIANSITVGFNGAVGPEDQSAQGGNAGAWTIMTHIMQIDAAETGLTVRCVNEEPGGNDTYFDAAITVFGTKPVAFKRSTWEDGALEARHVSVYNLALNSLFSYWTNGAAAPPDCYEDVGTCVTIQEAANVARGDFSAEVVLPDNAGTFRHTLGYSTTNLLAEALQSRYVTAKFQVLWIAGTKNLWVTLRSNVGVNDVTVEIDLDSCTPNFVTCAVIAFEVEAAATDIYLEFENLDAGAGAIEFYLDDVQLTATPWPCPPVIPNYWEIEVVEWTYAGSCNPVADTHLFKGIVGVFATNVGVQAGFYGVPLRVYVECNVTPAAAITFNLLQNAVPIDAITLTNPATEAQTHTNVPAWNRVIPSDNIGVVAVAGGSATEDIVVRWVFLKSAANTSEC